MTSEIGLVGLTPEPSSQASQSSNELGQDSFLQLLITQIQNQNPLDPADPTEFLTQLTSFSSLEQMTQIGQSIDSLAVLQATGLSLQNIDLVGKTVVYDGERAPVVDGQARFRLSTTAPAERIVVEYRDGSIERTAEVGPLSQGEHPLELSDLTGEFAQIKSITAYNGDTALDVAFTTRVVADVQGLTFEGGTPMLMLGHDFRLNPSDVLEILRTPETDD